MAIGVKLTTQRANLREGIIAAEPGLFCGDVLEYTGNASVVLAKPMDRRARTSGRGFIAPQGDLLEHGAGSPGRFRAATGNCCGQRLDRRGSRGCQISASLFADSKIVGIELPHPAAKLVRRWRRSEQRRGAYE